MDPAGGAPAAAGGEVWCVRLERMRAVAEHRECPYCFGGAEAVAQGEHAAFCDFDAARDPVAFGFPETRGRPARE